MKQTFHCFSKKVAAAHGYGAALVAAPLITGIALIFAGAYFMDDDSKATLMCVLVAAGFLLFFFSLYTANCRGHARLSAYAVNADGTLSVVQRSGARGIGLFAAGDLAGAASEAATGAGGELFEMAGTVAGIAAVNRLYKAMANPEIIQTMLERPDTVRGANVYCITDVQKCKESAHSVRIQCSGMNSRTKKAFHNKWFLVRFAYSNMENLLTAIDALHKKASALLS